MLLLSKTSQSPFLDGISSAIRALFAAKWMTSGCVGRFHHSRPEVPTCTSAGLHRRRSPQQRSPATRSFRSIAQMGVAAIVDLCCSFVQNARTRQTSRAIILQGDQYSSALSVGAVQPPVHTGGSVGCLYSIAIQAISVSKLYIVEFNSVGMRPFALGHR